MQLRLIERDYDVNDFSTCELRSNIMFNRFNVFVEWLAICESFVFIYHRFYLPINVLLFVVNLFIFHLFIHTNYGICNFNANLEFHDNDKIIDFLSKRWLNVITWLFHNFECVQLTVGIHVSHTKIKNWFYIIYVMWMMSKNSHEIYKQKGSTSKYDVHFPIFKAYFM